MLRGARCGRIWPSCQRLRLCCSRSAPGGSGSSNGKTLHPRRGGQIMKKNSDAGGKPNISNKEYAAEMRTLQVQLCKLQDWVKVTRQRIIVVFEGRDGAGKGG